MKNSYSRFSFRYSLILVVFTFLLVIFISFADTAGYAADFTVTNTNDTGAGSLRHAIENATSQDVITFELDYPAIITLDEQLSIDHGLTIQGPGAELLTVSGGGVCRVFYIEDTAESVDISGISIVSGDAGTEYGGGIYNKSDKLTVDNCHFSGNRAYGGGGMCNTYSHSPIVTNCTFASNSAFEDGGGMYNWTCTLKVTNCTFISNTANDGGGIYCDSSYSTVMNCTFTLNSANLGGGMWIGKAIPTIINSIFWGNTGGEIYNRFAHFSYCVISDDNPGDYGANNINTDPLLQELADNGGPTKTCALGEGSSAIDSGTDSGAPSTDQRGVPRPFNVSFDIGAYEYGLEVYEITATCSDGGNIFPTEAHSLGNGTEDEVFYLMPAEGYEIEAVYVDNVPDSYDEASNTYTFHNVSDDHVISADFQLSASDDDDIVNRDSDGCNISALSGMGLLLVLPLMFLSRKLK